MKLNVQEYIDALIPYRKKDAALETFNARAERLQLKDYPTLAPGSLRPHWAALAMKEPIRTLLMQDLESGSTDVLSSISDKRLVELAQDLITKEQQIEALIHSLPGLNNSERNQEQRIRELQKQLEEVEVKRKEAVLEKDRAQEKLDAAIMSVKRP